MFWTLLALLLWVVLGGFISYYGDLQGRRWGKKRVSWLGLRPKHTAILITSITGGVIALGSIISLMLIAPNVRHVMLRGEKAIEDNKRLIADQKQQQILLKLERGRAEADSHRVQAENDLKLAQRREEIRVAQGQLRTEKNRLALSIQSLVTANNRFVKLQQVSRVLHKSNQTLQDENQNVFAINKTLSDRNYGLEAQKEELERTNKNLASANTTLNEVNATLKRIGDTQRSANDLFYNRSVELEKQKNALEKEVAELTRDRDETLDLMRRRDELAEQISSLNQQIRQQNAVLRTGHVVLRAGVELGRLSIDAHLRPEAIKRQVENLLLAASEQAKSHGAAPSGGGRAVQLLPRRQVTLTGYEVTDENSQLDSYADQWSGQNDAYVIVATTAANCLDGEPAYVALHPYRIVRVFPKGAEVASRVIDGHSSVDTIIAALMAFLQKDVKESAIRAGTIPRVDPESGGMEVGVLGTADLFRLTDRVRRMHGPVVLSARARVDLSSADQLNLTFHVSRLRTESQVLQAP